MKNPFFRLVFISVNVVLWSAMVLMGLRHLGFLQTYAQYDHPLLAQKNLFFYKSNALPDNIKDIEIINKNLNWMPLLDIEYRNDEWAVVKETNKRPYRSDPLYSLQTYLENLKSNSLAVNVRNRQLTQFTKLVEILESKKDLKIVFTSDTTSLLREARKKEPSWLFMSSHTLISRLQVMGSLFLETMTSIDEDLIPISQDDEMNPRIIKEIKRRKKFMLLDLQNTKDVASLKDLDGESFYGFIASDFEKLQKLDSQNN